MAKTLRKLIMEYFEAHANQELSHGPIVDKVTEEWKKEHKNPPRDPWRMIRSLHEQGILQKIRKGVYKYDPQLIKKMELEDFSQVQKEQILRRDNYRCVICGRGLENGVGIVVDHIKPRSLGGKAEIINGQTLCSIHNLRKKNYGQTETGKKMFIRLHEIAKNVKDEELLRFCENVLKVYEEHHINDHIEWKK